MYVLMFKLKIKIILYFLGIDDIIKKLEKV